MDSCPVELRKSAEKDLRRITPDQLPRIVEAITGLGTDPLPHGCRKLADSDHTYRVRVGDYRVIYQFQTRPRGVVIERIRHRREVYRDL